MTGQYSRAQGNTNNSIAGKFAYILDVKFQQIYRVWSRIKQLSTVKKCERGSECKESRNKNIRINMFRNNCRSIEYLLYIKR